MLINVYYWLSDTRFSKLNHKVLMDSHSDMGFITIRPRTRTANTNAQLAKMCLKDHLDYTGRDDAGEIWVALQIDEEYVGQYKIKYRISFPIVPAPEIHCEIVDEDDKNEK